MKSNEYTPAAQYIRTSTPVQDASLGSQKQAIANYAAANRFEIVATYEDCGRSGLGLAGREGLRRLLNDVISGDHRFSAILVYDVSRWGRFQDPDEGAHYEFVCKSAGVKVRYCTEPVVNDGTAPGAILKALYRTMAAEYSRELGARVRAAQQLLVYRGFRMGSAPGFGFRRLLISADGEPKKILRPGECKAVANERVILVHGPAEEVRCVQEIFRMLLRGRNQTAIVSSLNRRGLLWQDGTTWNLDRVAHVLRNPKYAGIYVWGKTRCRLGTVTYNPDTACIIRHCAFQGIVSEEMFDQVQNIRRDRRRYKSDDEMLHKLRTLLASKGRLSEAIIENSSTTPSLTAYLKRFGSMKKIYELLGYERNAEYLRRAQQTRRTQLLHQKIVQEILSLFEGMVELAPKRRRSCRSTLRFHNGQKLSVIICPCRESHSWKRYWVLDPIIKERFHPTLLCALQKDNRRVDRFYLVSNLNRSARLKFSREGPFLRGARMLSGLPELYDALTSILAEQRRSNTFPKSLYTTNPTAYGERNRV